MKKSNVDPDDSLRIARDDAVIEGKQRNAPCAEGYLLGANLARFADDELAKHPEIPERCATCAFRAGSFPNGCVTTVMDATKCMIEGVEFACHDAHRKGQPCSGWLALKFEESRAVAPWKFSDEYNPSAGDLKKV